MMTNLYSMVGEAFVGGWIANLGMWLLPVAIWSVIWKGLALWKAAQRGSKIWFVALLVVNTVGVLEILYLYVFTKKTSSTEEEK